MASQSEHPVDSVQSSPRVASSRMPSEPADKQQLSPEEEEEQKQALLLADSKEIKTIANEIFLAAKYTDAIDIYEYALTPLPPSANFERAVLYSNIAACEIKLERWKAAVKAATRAVEGLDVAEGKVVKDEKDEEEEKGKGGNGTEDKGGEGGAEMKKVVVEEPEEADEEIITPLAADVEASMPKLTAAQQRSHDGIRAKALLRRGKARTELATWATLQVALEEDYKVLGEGRLWEGLSSRDRRVVSEMKRDLPARIKEAQSREMGEMMGKLKDLGNGILKPFGLSTDMFKMVKDEKTGGYSMNFNQGQGEGE